MELLINDGNSTICDEWDEYVNSNTDCGLYHSIKFINFISSYFNYDKYLFYTRGNHKINGILPMVKAKVFPYGKQFVSHPFVGSYNSICADNQDIKNYIVDGLTAFIKNTKIRFAELRERSDESLDLPSYDIFANYELDLTENIHEIWSKNIHSKTRNQIRKAKNNNLIWNLYGEEGINKFYEVYALTMRQLGSPSLSKSFFMGLIRSFPDEMRIAIVTIHKKPISVLWLVKSKNKVHNPWAGFNREYQHLCPNNLNYWKSIEWAKQLDCKTFDFGRSIRNSGQAKFKMQWGVIEVLLTYYYVLNEKEKIPEINPTNMMIRYMTKLWKLIPHNIQSHIGERFASRVP
mgnify:CR=1 FL=1